MGYDGDDHGRPRPDNRMWLNQFERLIEDLRQLEEELDTLRSGRPSVWSRSHQRRLEDVKTHLYLARAAIQLNVDELHSQRFGPSLEASQ